MAFTRRVHLFTRQRDPLDPDLFDDWEPWVDAMLAAGLPTDEIRARIDAERERRLLSAQRAEEHSRARDRAEMVAEARAMATERLLREAGF